MLSEVEAHAIPFDFARGDVFYSSPNSFHTSSLS
ncbi:hypothetical protein CLV60_11968 [Dyadobacter jiangsuensis]|uniref:Uncharacterized protein n=1 Tax=Dyadobacter jiangsuensis TaxID=1591085 RepID=A0A2P8FLV4_9BACT|nr:hypothetical protein CLV60_11968 [Dyadobacter jiangsuensis]